MSTTPSPAIVPESERNTDPGVEYARLRELLVGPEQLRLEALRRRLDDPQLRAEDLSQVLAEAIALRVRRDRALQKALNPLVEEALRESVTRNPRILADALFPVIGKAVRKAVAHSLGELVESINRTLERSVSVDAIRWRVEALRTGRPFAEIVLTHSANYRVEQIFLIHRGTGLLLQHVARSDQVLQDSDLVSGMLTAIQDFVRDSFTGTTDQELETIELGEFRVWVQHGPAALLAAVVVGTPPPELRHRLERTLEQVHDDYGAALAAFKGDASSLYPARPLLQACLLGRQAGPATKRSRRFAIAAAVFLSLLLVACAIYGFYAIRAQRRWDRLVERLRQQPGVILTSAERSGGRYRLIGFRDPLSDNPDELIRASGIDPQNVTAIWEPFASLNPKLNAVRNFVATQRALGLDVLRFPLNSDQLSQEETVKLDDIEARILSLQHEGTIAGRKFVIEVQGHTDPTGSEEKNEVLSQARAEAIVRALAARGISTDLLRPVAVGSRNPVRAGGEYPSELNRRVSFRVVQREAAQ